jgi:MFS family permease
MKIASDYYQAGLGKSLGFLVGALVLGTAFPHLLKTLNQGFDWQNVIYGTSILSAAGGIMMWLFVADGPFRKKATAFRLTAFTRVFRSKSFRTAAFGYFGHMWELYAFWAFVPFMLKVYQNIHSGVNLNVSLYAFIIIASGSVACVISGLICEHFGVEKVAFRSLLLSMLCCLISPFFIVQGSLTVFITFLLFWGMVVIADSPLFSTLVARHAPVENRGAALTIVNCLGFTITILSIQLLSVFTEELNPQYGFMILAVGPIIGLVFSINKVPKVGETA